MSTLRYGCTKKTNIWWPSFHTYLFIHFHSLQYCSLCTAAEGSSIVWDYTSPSHSLTLIPVSPLLFHRFLCLVFVTFLCLVSLYWNYLYSRSFSGHLSFFSGPLLVITLSLNFYSRLSTFVSSCHFSFHPFHLFYSVFHSIWPGLSLSLCTQYH